MTFGYTFNLAGQPSSVSVSNALYQNSSSLATGSYSPDGQNRYTSAGGSSLNYDGNANVNAIGAQGYGYDALNRMTSAGAATLVYDALSRLSQVSGGGGTTKFLYDGAQIIGEYNASGSLQRRYIPGPGLDNPYLWFEGSGTAAGNARWLLGDAFGSIIAVGTSGASNTTLGVNTYDEYGVSAATNVGRFQYKGMALIQESGLYYARARMYAPRLGRFMQPDPIGYGDGMNRYAFVHNAPINGRDVWGLYGRPACSSVTIPGTGGVDEFQIICPSPPSAPITIPVVNPPRGTGGGDTLEEVVVSATRPQEKKGLFDGAKEWWCRNVPAASYSLGGLELQVHFFVVAIDLNVDFGFTTHFQLFGSGSAAVGAGFGLGVNALEGVGGGVGATRPGFSGETGVTAFGSLGLIGPAAGGNIQFSGDSASAAATSLRGRGGVGLGGGAFVGPYASGKAATPSACGA